MKRPASLPWAVLGPLILLAGLAPAAWAQARSYTLDRDHSWVTFEVLHFGTSTIRGRIGPIEGSVTLDPTAGTGEVGLTIPTATVDTGLAVFNSRLRQDDLLASSTHPVAYFVARRFTFDGPRVQALRGEFTWRGVSQPLELRAQRYSCREAVHEGARVEVCGGDFEGEVSRSEHGATFGLPLVGDRVRLLVQVEGRRPLP